MEICITYQTECIYIYVFSTQAKEVYTEKYEIFCLTAYSMKGYKCTYLNGVSISVGPVYVVVQPVNC